MEEIMNPMSLNEYENEVITKIRQLLKIRGKNCFVTAMDHERNNGSCRVIMIGDYDRQFGAGFDLEAGYQNYLNGQSPDEYARMAVREFSACPEHRIIEKIPDYDSVRNQLFLRVNSADRCSSAVRKAPHRKIADLILTCHILISIGDKNIQSTIVTEQLRRLYGISRKQLFEDTVASSEKLFPARIVRMKSFLFSEEEKDDDSSPLIVTNSRSVNGASSFFYPGIMEKAAEMFKGSYFAVPSSIHEMLLIRDADTSLSRLETILHECNRTVVSPDEVLSEKVCFYDCVTKTLRSCDSLIA